LLGYFTANDWHVIPAAPPMRGRNQLPPLSFCSPWLSMNILSLDARTVCVEASETAVADQLSHLGFEVIPVPFWNVAPFGGGLHCATADIERDGGPEDYFPNRYGRF
jgi:glycine amidinotransferase